MNKKLFGSVDITSSNGTGELAKTVEGLIISASSLIIFFSAKWFGVSLLDTQISLFATQAGLAVGSLVFFFGIIRKLLTRLSW
jgi:hypothetical protein